MQVALNQRGLLLDFWVRFPSLKLGLRSVSLCGSEGRPLVRKRHQNKHLDSDLVLLRTRRSGVRVPPGAPIKTRFSEGLHQEPIPCNLPCDLLKRLLSFLAHSLSGVDLGIVRKACATALRRFQRMSTTVLAHVGISVVMSHLQIISANYGLDA